MGISVENWLMIGLTACGVIISLLGLRLQYLHIEKVPQKTKKKTQQFGGKKQKGSKQGWLLVLIGILLLAGTLVWHLLSDKVVPCEGGNESGTHGIHGVEIDTVQKKEQLIVFAGGGSVVNMIKDITKDSVDIKKYSNSIYLDLPSTNAWPLLAEEVMINHTSDSVTNKFYPVCLSALEATDSVFCKIVDSNDFMNRGTVISYYLGNDILEVYTNQSIGMEGKILIGELSKKVEEWFADKSVDVYITQEGSGTYLTYQQFMKDTIDIDNFKGILKWYDSKLLYKNLKGNFIVLSSKYYTPEDIRGRGKCKPKMVINERGDTLTKAMYLYFAGYTNPSQPYVSIPDEMVEFLKRIKNDTASIIKTRMHQDTTMIITPLDSLMRWEEVNNK